MSSKKDVQEEIYKTPAGFLIRSGNRHHSLNKSIGCNSAYLRLPWCLFTADSNALLQC